jgi:hypothetical protein
MRLFLKKVKWEGGEGGIEQREQGFLPVFFARKGD